MINRKNEIVIEGKKFCLIDELQTVTKGLFYMVESTIEGENGTKIVRKIGKNNYEIIIEKAYNDLDTEIIDYYDIPIFYGNAHLI